MNETLYDRAVSNYNVSVSIYNAMEDDEAYLNFIGYHLQQALELTMKYLLEKEGVEYPKTHDIDQLIRIANENNTDFYLTDYIRDHSEMFSLWEARTRYIMNYRLEFSKVEKALDGVGEYLDAVYEKEFGYYQSNNSDLTEKCSNEAK